MWNFYNDIPPFTPYMTPLQMINITCSRRITYTKLFQDSRTPHVHSHTVQDSRKLSTMIYTFNSQDG